MRRTSGHLRQTNFVVARPARPGRLALVLWLAAILLGAAAVWAAMDARDTKLVADRLETHRARLTDDLARLNASDAAVPSAGEFAELAAAADRLNTLSGARRMPLPDLLVALETVLPDEVWVGQLAYATDTGAFFLSLLGEEETALPLALQRVEAIEGLGEVILERQARVRLGSQMLLQYDVRAVAR